MKNKYVLLRIIVLVLLVSLTLTACKDEGLEDGFIWNSGASDGRFAGYKSEKSEFDIDNITLDFYYGHSAISLSSLKKYLSYPIFYLYFLNEDEERIIVKQVNDEFMSEKYNVRTVDNRIVYEHKETLTIPKEIFNKEKGTIYFGGYGDNVLDDKDDYEILFARNIHYKVEGDKVILSNKPFD